MLKIPLHSLVVLIGPSGGGKTTFANKYFKSYEIVSFEKIKEELTGSKNSLHANELVLQEFHHRIKTKLLLGERVIADASHLLKKNRIKTVEIGTKLHIPVIYIVINRSIELKKANLNPNNLIDNIEKEENIFKSQEKDILKGDNMATVIDTRMDIVSKTENIEIIDRINFDNLTNDLVDRNFNGVAIIGDVHGMANDFEEKIKIAEEKNYFIIQLGDLIDYGPNSIKTVDLMYRLVVNGRAAFIIGNHERKLEKYFKQKNEGNIRIEIKGGMVQTIEQLNNLGPVKEKLFENRFKALMNYARHHIVFTINNKKIMVVHASGTKSMWKNRLNRLKGYEENRAVFGEIDHDQPKLPDGYPNRIYNWVDDIPVDHKIYVGHAVLSVDEIIIKKNKNGGQAIFLDTGSAKNIQGHQGKLSMIFEDFNITNID